MSHPRVGGSEQPSAGMTAGADERPVMQDVGQGYKIWANSPVTTAAGQAGQGNRAEAGETYTARGGAIAQPSCRVAPGAVTSAAAMGLIDAG